ncbi:proclotting enzyme-like [Copidosoma floridanum]|uniref:proclotting enzyme-like n=1 Tax=Copidosoma floridanum TaxID=29053 RepID=UPI000C6FAF3E|nr:proclotting enzyme-like [Copidosoma floridanum]
MRPRRPFSGPFLRALLVIAASIAAAESASDGFPEAASSLRSRTKAAESVVRSKRFVVPEKIKPAINKQYQACIAPGSKPGHCKHLSSCGDANYRLNLPRLMENLCVIEKEFVGVCCPDDASESSDAHNEVLPFGGVAGELPAIASEVDEQPKTEPQRGSRARSRGCGISAVEASRVTGGRPTSTRDFPWIVAILSHGEQYCGGVLITDRHVLTAAHCVHRRKPRELTIRLGEYDLRYPNETRALDFKVVEIRIHNGYVPSTYRNDIAIVKVHRPTVFNTYIWPVCLPPVGANFENKQATVIGWGTTSFGGATSYVLLEVKVPIWPLSECVDKFTQEISDKNLCAAVYTGNGDACQVRTEMSHTHVVFKINPIRLIIFLFRRFFDLYLVGRKYLEAIPIGDG